MSGKKKVFDDGFDVFEGKKDFIDKFSEKVATLGESVMDIPTEKIKVKENVRKEYTGIEDLAESIRQKGLLQPIVVTKAEDGFFEIVFGHRRFKALLHLNEKEPGAWLKIKAFVKDKDAFDADEIKEIQLIENIQRESLGALELKEALEYLRSRGLTQKQIGERLGKSEGHVRNLFMTVKTLNENPELKDLMEHHTGVMSSDLIYLRILPKKELLQVAEEKATGKIKTRTELEKRIEEVRGEIYKDGKAERETRAAKPLFKEKDSLVRVRSFAFDRTKLSPDERQKLLTQVREIVAKLEESTEAKS